jgi:hypothetical protein
MGSLFANVLCAFCRLERKVCTKKSANWTNVLSAMLASTLVMLLIWQTFDPKVVIIFSVFLVVSEIFVRMRWRIAMPCPHCGFDPVLYKTDRKETVRRVKAKLVHVRTSGSHLFKSQNPLERLPVVHQNTSQDGVQKKAPATLISRQV